jgi:hypothetical protein
MEPISLATDLEKDFGGQLALELMFELSSSSLRSRNAE